MRKLQKGASAIAQAAENAVAIGTAGPSIGRVLVATRDPRGPEEFLRVLGQCRLQPVPASTVAESRELLRRGVISMVLCEEEIADGNYREILQQVGGFATRIPVVVFSRIADWDRYLEAMRSGAFDYLPHPCSTTEIESVISRALRMDPLFP